MNNKIKSLLLCVFFIALFGTSACNPLDSRANPKPCALVTNADAEKVLGKPVQPANESIEVQKDTRLSKCTYSTFAKDNAGTESGVLFFILAENTKNPNADDTKAIMSANRDAHAKDKLQNLEGIGDEAFLYIKEEIGNDYHIWARKNTRIFTFQLTSDAGEKPLNELKALSKKIAGQL